MTIPVRDFTLANPAPFVSPASYWTPVFMPQTAWAEHAPFAFWIIDAARPRTMVELGVHNGFSYFAFCQAVRKLFASTRCFGVDAWVGDEHAGFYDEEVYQAVSRHNRRYEGFSRLIRATFADACSQFADGSIDLLHIDGFHTYEAVRDDFESWLPKMSARGIMLFHDTAERGGDFGVYRLWDEVRRRYPHFSFRHGHGLGVLGVGTDVPLAVRRLFEASGDFALRQAIRSEYERLGAYAGARQRIDEQDAEIKRLIEHTRQLESALNKIRSSILWRASAPLRAAARAMRGAGAAAGRVHSAVRNAMTPGESGTPALRIDR